MKWLDIVAAAYMHACIIMHVVELCIKDFVWAPLGAMYMYNIIQFERGNYTTKSEIELESDSDELPEVEVAHCSWMSTGMKQFHD